MSEYNFSSLPSSQALAFIGDSVHSLAVRKRLAEAGISKSKALNSEFIKYTTAVAQARLFEKIKPYLTEQEVDIARRASNSTHLNNHNGSTPMMDYRLSTGLEALLGALYLIGDFERIDFLLKFETGESLKEQK